MLDANFIMSLLRYKAGGNTWGAGENQKKLIPKK